LTKYLTAVLGHEIIKKKRYNPFKKYSKTQSNLFYNFGLKSDAWYGNVVEDINVYAKASVLNRRALKSDDHEGEFSSLVFHHKFLSYNYLLNFTVSRHQWYTHFSKSIRWNPLVYALVESYHDFSPQTRLTSSWIASHSLLLDRYGAATSNFLNDPLQFVEVYNHKYNLYLPENPKARGYQHFSM